MNYLLSELAEPLKCALERLRAKNEALSPFVIAQKVTDQSVFVQWCTKDGRLLFDVPWAYIYAEPMTLEDSVDLAFDLLRERGVRHDDRILIVEEQNRVKGDRERWPIWKKLFGFA